MSPERGQRFIKAVVHSPNFGLFGEKTVLAFMINRKITPHIFNGHIMEIDFDIRDAVQMTDLLDLCPDLVSELEPNYKKYLEMKKAAGDVVDAQYTIKKENDAGIDPLLEDKKPDGPQKTPPKKENVDPDEHESEDERPIETIIRNGKTAAEIASTAIPYLPIIRKFNSPDKNSEEKIQKIIGICNKSPAHRKLLYWVPELLGVYDEIQWIVSQSRPIRTGVDPSYYKAQSGAQIAEKVLSRPPQKEGWQTVVLILGIVALTVVAIALIMHGKI